MEEEYLILMSQHEFSVSCVYKLTELLVGYNHDFMQWCNNYTFFNILTEKQRNQLFKIIIDNDLLLYTVFLNDKTNECNFHKNFDNLKRVFNDFENSFKQVF